MLLISSKYLFCNLLIETVLKSLVEGEVEMDGEKEALITAILLSPIIIDNWVYNSRKTAKSSQDYISDQRIHLIKLN